LERARKRGARELVARTSTALEAANRLYRSMGFVYSGTDRSGDYQRPTIVLKHPLR
jgi:L-amino acid N-acyltransferase YncA